MGYHFVDILITLSLFLIMFGIGLSLKIDKFKQLFAHPKPIIIGLMAQMLFLPLLGFFIGFITNLPPEIKVGILILSVCPGGTTSNFITYLLNGNTELSISLTSINSVITLFSIPFIVNLGLVFFLGESTSFHLPFLKTLLQVFYISILPAALGVYVNAKHPKTTKILNTEISFKLIPKMGFNYIKSITVLLLASVFIIKVFADKNSGGADLTTADFIMILPIMLVFNVIGLVFGYIVSILGKLNKDAIPMTIGIEVGLQNTTLAFLVAGTLLQNTEMQKPALVYALFSFFTALLFGFIIKKIGISKKLKQVQ